MEMENFVFYADWLDVLHTIETTQGRAAAEKWALQMLEYGCTGHFTTDDALIIGMITSFCGKNIAAARERYNAACANGAKGGRPIKIDRDEVIQLREQGLTQEAIAEKVGASLSQVGRILREYALTQTQQDDVAFHSISYHTPPYEMKDLDGETDNLPENNVSFHSISYHNPNNNININNNTDTDIDTDIDIDTDTDIDTKMFSDWNNLPVEKNNDDVLALQDSDRDDLPISNNGMTAKQQRDWVKLQAYYSDKPYYVVEWDKTTRDFWLTDLSKKTKAQFIKLDMYDYPQWMQAFSIDSDSEEDVF